MHRSKSSRFEKARWSLEQPCRRANMFNFEREMTISVPLFISTLSHISICVSSLIQDMHYLHTDNQNKCWKLHLSSTCYTQHGQLHLERLLCALLLKTIGSILNPLLREPLQHSMVLFTTNAPAFQFVNKARWDGNGDRQLHCTVGRQEVFKGYDNTKNSSASKPCFEISIHNLSVASIQNYFR